MSESPERGPPQPAELGEERRVMERLVEGGEDGRPEEIVLHNPQTLRALVLRALMFPLGLVSPVLEPYLHLGFGESQAGGQVSPLRGRQVLLVVELLLKFNHLAMSKRCAGALLLPSGFEPAGLLQVVRTPRVFTHSGRRLLLGVLLRVLSGMSVPRRTRSVNLVRRTRSAVKT